jgi:predicted PurR-regulated permease PerM
MAETGKLRQLLHRKAFDERAAVAAPDVTSADDDDLPGPSDLKEIYLGALLVLALLAACYVAAEIILPIFLACVLTLVLQPLMRALARLPVPRGIAALLIILLLFGTLAGLGTVLSAPAASWAQKLPTGIPKLQERLSAISRPMAAVERYLEKAQALAPGSGPEVVPVEIRGPGLFDELLASTRSFAGGLFETALVLFFMLLSGNTFLRRMVEILPRFRNKRQVVEISVQIERDVAAYLLTITIMNLVVGVVYGVVTMLCGLDDPLLWGAVAFLLNFVPILGPMLGFVVFLLVGLLSQNDLWPALLPAGFYLIIHIVEGELVTPMLVARRFTINPALVVLALVFWYWMWGVPGAVLATPMLAIAKIVCDRIGPLRPLGHFIEG